MIKKSDLGSGAYAKVHLVRYKGKSKEYAMKIVNIYRSLFYMLKISKEKIYRFELNEKIKSEIRIQRKIIRKNIVRLFHYFEDNEYVYLILEYAKNGNLFQYI